MHFEEAVMSEWQEIKTDLMQDLLTGRVRVKVNGEDSKRSIG